MVAIAGIGLFCYLSRLSYSVFQNSLLFPLVLSFLGIGLISLGLTFQRYEHDIYALADLVTPDVARYYSILQNFQLPPASVYVCWSAWLYEQAVAHAQYLTLLVAGAGVFFYLCGVLEKYVIEEPVRVYPPRNRFLPPLLLLQVLSLSLSLTPLVQALSCHQPSLSLFFDAISIVPVCLTVARSPTPLRPPLSSLAWRPSGRPTRTLTASSLV